MLQIDGAPPVVGQARRVEDLEQERKDAGIGFFDLVQQDDAARLVAHPFGQFAVGLLRGADQAEDVVGRFVLIQVEANHPIRVAGQELGERADGLRFAHTGLSQKQKTSERTLRARQPLPDERERVGHGGDGGGLPDDLLFQKAAQVVGFGGGVAFEQATRQPGVLFEHGPAVVGRRVGVVADEGFQRFGHRAGQRVGGRVAAVQAEEFQ